MTEIRNSLNTLATAIESLQNAPIPEPTILDRQLSGNKINGGSITSFASTGITDRATSKILVIRDDGLHVDVLHATTVNNPLTVKGDLTVEGTVHATRMHVDELTADIRTERSEPLAFLGKDNATAYGQG